MPNLGAQAMIVGGAAKAVIGLSSLGLLLAQAATTAPVDPLSSVGRLSLDACLITAVGVLWKTISRKDDALASKDAILLGVIEKMTQAMERVSAGSNESRSDLSQLRDSIRELIDIHRKGEPQPDRGRA